MNFTECLIAIVALVLIIGVFIFYLKSNYFRDKEIKLPTPSFDGKISVEKAIKTRRSIRSYKQEPLTLVEISQLLWAAQGITGHDEYRSAPSAGATYPLEIYLIASVVKNLDAGIYKYSNNNHSLIKIASGDKRNELSQAALSQEWVKEAPISLVICGIYERTSKKYGENGTKFVHMEAGCVAQNVYLQAISLGLGTVLVGTFDNAKVLEILTADTNENALSILPVGRIN